MIAIPDGNVDTTDGYVVAYNATDDDFEMVAQSGGASELDDLSDVGTIDVTAAQVLVADGTDYESVAITGDVTITSAGATTIAQGQAVAPVRAL